MIPVMQTLIFGYALETQIDNIPTVVYDLDGRQDVAAADRRVSRTRGSFTIIERVLDEDDRSAAR